MIVVHRSSRLLPVAALDVLSCLIATMGRQVFVTFSGDLVHDVPDSNA